MIRVLGRSKVVAEMPLELRPWRPLLDSRVCVEAARVEALPVLWQLELRVPHPQRKHAGRLGPLQEAIRAGQEMPEQRTRLVVATSILTRSSPTTKAHEQPSTNRWLLLHSWHPHMLPAVLEALQSAAQSCRG